MKGNSMIMFPNEFCDSYIHNIDDWWTSKEYADKLYSNFMKLQLKEPKEDMIRIVFSSKKLGEGGNYAVMFVPVALHEGDAHIKGIKHLGDFTRPPSKSLFNEAYIELYSDDDVNEFNFGKRLNIGVSENMADVKEVIEGWLMGYIGEEGATPDFRYVDYF